MPPACARSLIAVCFSLQLSPGSLLAQHPSLKDWELICFCNSRVSTPHVIIKMDNNGAILYAAREGIARSRLLQQGIPVTESQLRLLEDWSLLSEANGVLRTGFPVLAPEKTGPLRSDLRAAARAGLPALRPYIDTILGALAVAGDKSAAYAVVFSYVLDGLVWDQLWPDTALVSTGITLEKPYWNGAFWAISPKRTRAPGTNSHRIDDSATVMLTWTDGTLKLLGPLQRKPNLDALVRAIRQRDTALVPEELRPYGLLHANGSPDIAVIEDRSGNPVSVAGRAMARVVAQQMNEWLAQAEVQRRLGTDNRGLALLIAYHEYMWELLGALTEQHVLQEPAAFGSAAPRPEGVRPLILLITK